MSYYYNVKRRSYYELHQMSNTTKYDAGLNETFQAEFRNYFEGLIDFDTALSNFYNTATYKYPALNY